jgi:hypothetical protein
MRTSDVQRTISRLEDSIATTMSEEISKQIDFEILIDALIKSGWTKVVLSPMTHEHGLEIDEWVRHNCRSGVQYMGLVWLFEDAKEATMFILRWS